MIPDLMTPEDFYQFFDKIPAERWCTDVFMNGQGQCCAMGHLGHRNTSEREVHNSSANSWRLEQYLERPVSHINDEPLYGPDPKTRILNRLTWRINGRKTHGPAF